MVAPMTTTRALLAAALCFAAGYGLARQSGSDLLAPDALGARIRAGVAAPGRLEQAAAIVPVLEALDAENAPRIAEAFEAVLPASAAGLPLDLFVEAWARVDPASCRARVASWQPDRQRQVWPALARSWARTEPERALEAIRALPDVSMRYAAEPGLVEGWSRSDRPGLFVHLAQLSDRSRRRALAALAATGRVDTAGAAAVADELARLRDAGIDEGARADVAIAGIEAIARSDLPRALDLTSTLEANPGYAEALRRVAVQWVQRDAEAALAWLRERSVGAPRDAALRAAYREWYLRDAARAATWIEAHRGDPELAHAVLAHVLSLALADSARAQDWIGTLADAALRQQASELVAQIEASREELGAQRQTPAADRAPGIAAPHPEN
jgi:hypothetical protein